SIAGHNNSGDNDTKYVHDRAGSYIKFSSENMPYRFPVMGASLQENAYTVPSLSLIDILRSPRASACKV
ncbi:hypothetical protein, partial [Escherichia coli]|uniref:hypothetical protein n=1 Tax=Escherichia coli TaxID=562 RepID=UPI001BFD2D43